MPRLPLRPTFLAIALCAAAPLLAQPYPSKPIRVVVGFPPGGTNDILARMIAQKLTENLGQAVIVDNRPGANSIIGSELVARSAPDGYTLLLNSVVHAINAGLYKKLPYDPVNDFAPVILLASGQLVLVTHPSLPVNSVKQLVALAKARPGEINYASTSSGGSPHLAMELFKTMAGGLKIVHIPYKGTGPAFTDLLSGQVPLMFSPLLPALPHIKAGKLRALAVGSSKRAPVVPEVPTMAESGLPGFEASAWFGVFAPARTSKDVVGRLNAEIVKILQVPDLRGRLSSQGADPIGSTPEQFGDYVRSEIAKWARVIEASGARAE
ncbi:MAG: tripartite tricarboxylate transporter substrate binding protein [Betaproteobacteria bacterium]|nr:tripartite tricarboxylate transporter substrate binding protein [Betaproteobacteria bacterium]